MKVAVVMMGPMRIVLLRVLHSSSWAPHQRDVLCELPYISDANFDDDVPHYEEHGHAKFIAFSTV
jgi:hypothetical protein